MDELQQAIQGYQRLIDSAATNATRRHYEQLKRWLIELRDRKDCDRRIVMYRNIYEGRRNDNAKSQ